MSMNMGIGIFDCVVDRVNVVVVNYFVSAIT